MLPPILLLSSILLLADAVSAQWLLQKSGTTARLRGVSAVSALVAWAAGTQGTYLRTTDGGATWQAATVPGAADLDFRDVEAFDADTAYLLSIGEGERSRIYKTTDGGRRWSLQYVNRDPQGFLDAMAFWDANHGLALGDPLDGHFLMLETRDGGATWQELPIESRPVALAGEAAFAASGTCIAAQGTSNVWFVTGGVASRVFRSTDGGRTWAVSATPVPSGSQSGGIFSVAFSDAKHGVVVGGDYKKEGEARDNTAMTDDGGRTWRRAKGPLPGGYRSAVAYTAKSSRALVAVGPSGTDYSRDGGASWANLGTEGFHAVSFAKDGAGWAVGENGRVAKFTGPPVKNKPRTQRGRGLSGLR